MKRLYLIPTFGLLLGIATFSQAPNPRSRMAELEQQTLSEKFRGITTSGTPAPGLFPVRSSGVSTTPVRNAAEAFLGSLTEEQRKPTVYAVDDQEWQKWSNVHFYKRQGIGFIDMNERQRELAFALLHAGLSAKGLAKTRDIMRLNYSLAEIANDFKELGEWLYYITIMGEPSATKPWGWQLDGHHVIINYFVLGDQVVMTPTFMGSEPVRAESGKYKDTVVMQEEQNKGLALMGALEEPQRKKAAIETSKTGNNNLSEAFKDNIVLDYAGIRASEFSAKQKKLLLDLVQEYVGNMDDGHARVRMEEVRKHLDATYFAWIGPSDPNAVFYYRVHSPVILIEFDHQRPVFMPGPRVPFRQHIHTVVRTPNGNDYGKDLLRQHYARQHKGG